MSVNVRIRNGLCPDPTTGDGGATEGDIRGSFSDIIDVIGVKDLAGGHCAVTQNSPAAMSVLVAPGIVYIPNADYDELDSNQVRFWEAIITVSTAVTITANTSGSTRIDLICAKMDTAITPDEHASNIATLVAVAGTPGAGTPATPDNHYVLATVAVANGASTIVNADITNTRVQSKIDFDFLPKATGAEINTGTEDAKIVTPKAIADSKVSITDKAETLTNKTLTSPQLNTPSISNPYKFSAYRNAAVNSPNNKTETFVFDAEFFDTNNNFNTSTGEYTVPVAGFYQFNACLTHSTNDLRTLITICKGSTEILRGIDNDTEGTAITVNVGGLVQLAANDVITVRLFTSSSVAMYIGTKVANAFSGYLVSTT